MLLADKLCQLKSTQGCSGAGPCAKVTARRFAEEEEATSGSSPTQPCEEDPDTKPFTAAQEIVSWISQMEPSRSELD